MERGRFTPSQPEDGRHESSGGNIKPRTSIHLPVKQGWRLLPSRTQLGLQGRAGHAWSWPSGTARKAARTPRKQLRRAASLRPEPPGPWAGAADFLPEPVRPCPQRCPGPACALDPGPPANSPAAPPPAASRRKCPPRALQRPLQSPRRKVGQPFQVQPVRPPRDTLPGTEHAAAHAGHVEAAAHPFPGGFATGGPLDTTLQSTWRILIK